MWWIAACSTYSPSESSLLPPPTLLVPEISHEPLADLVLARRFLVNVPVEVTCTAPDVPEERHHLAGQGTIDLFGLLADTDYTCVWLAAGAGGAVDFRTDPLPVELPTWTMALEAPADGYTLFNHGRPTFWNDREAKLLIVDPDGRLRWYHFIEPDASDLDCQYLGDGRVLYGGGYAARPTIVGLDTIVQLRAPTSSTGRVYHHHAEQTGDGTVWALALADNLSGKTEWDGFVIDVLDPKLSTQVWSWDSQRGVDEGWLPVAEEFDIDPYHANSLQITDDAIYVNLRNQARVVKLDRATGAQVWSLGKGDDFALVTAAGDPEDDGQWFGLSHAPEIEPDGRLIIYDNRLAGPTSRIIEYELDEVAMTAQVTWQWTEPGWYDPIWGDVDRLPNGNILVTQAHNQSPTGPRSDRTSIIEIEPVTERVVWRLRMDSADDGGYRAARIDSCAIFANEAYCPQER